jgi:chaperonin GroES
VAKKVIKKKTKTAQAQKKSAKKPVKKATAKAAPKAKKKAAPKSAKKVAAKGKKKVLAKAAPKPVKKPARPEKSQAPMGKVLELDRARNQKASEISKIFSPLDDRIVIQPEGKGDRTPGGLYIPETVGDRPNQGKVVAVGRGRLDKKGHLHPLDVQLGDIVMYGQFSGAEIKLNGADLLVVRESDVLGVVKT